MGDVEGALRGAEAHSKPRRAVYLTGFGKFGDIEENPTTELVQELADDVNVTEAVVLETSAGGSMEMLQPLREKAEADSNPCIFVHLGVAASATMLRLEQCGYNVADFRIPDERGWQADKEVILEGEENALETHVPLEHLLPFLQEKSDVLMKISTDPGRYICNYVYFHSLVWAEKMKTNGRDNCLALFVHVPQFTEISKENQVSVLRLLLEWLSAL